MGMSVRMTKEQMIERGIFASLALSVVAMLTLSFLWFSTLTPVYMVDMAEPEALVTTHRVKAGETVTVPRHFCVRLQPPVAGINTRALVDEDGREILVKTTQVENTLLVPGCYMLASRLSVPFNMRPGHYMFTMTTIHQLSPVTRAEFAYQPIPVIVEPADPLVAAVLKMETKEPLADVPVDIPVDEDVSGN